MTVSAGLRLSVLSLLCVVVLLAVVGVLVNGAGVPKRGEPRGEAAEGQVETRNSTVSTKQRAIPQRMSRDQLTPSQAQALGLPRRDYSFNISAHWEHSTPDWREPHWEWFCFCEGCLAYACFRETSVFCCCDFNEHENPKKEDKVCHGCEADECRGYPYPPWPPQDDIHHHHHHNEIDSDNNKQHHD